MLAMAALFLLVAPATATDDDSLPGRDGQYQFDALNLEGTVWQGRLIPEAEMIIRFEHDGVLYYKYVNGPTMSRAGSWKQTGSGVYLETNNKYAEYQAVIRGDRLIGEAHNIRPFQWKWEMKRVPASTLKHDPDAGKQPIGNK
jgi:hypothetical protein